MKALRWVTPAVLVIELVLLMTGLLDLGQAAIVLMTVEFILALAVVTAATLRFRQARRTGASSTGSLSEAINAVLPGPLANLAKREAAMLGAVVRWVLRRPLGTVCGARTISYGADQVMFVITFVVLTAVEVVVVELLVPWAILRVALVILGGYGLLMMTGFVAINRTRPHVLDNERLRLRCGAFADFTLDPADIAAVSAVRHNCSYRPEISNGLLSMGAGNQTHLEILLTASRIMSVDRASGAVQRIRVGADDPTAAVRILQQAITKGRASGPQ